MVSKPLVVIGGGAAGMSAASAARRVEPDLEIVVLEAGGYSAYGMCGLPYYFSGAVARPASEKLVLDLIPGLFFLGRCAVRQAQTPDT